MTQFDIIIRNGTVVDGTGGPRYTADIAVKNGVIEKIEKNFKGSAKQEIDASGLIVAPGVIDLHTHYDAQLHWDPYCTGSGWHGHSTVMVNNCGFGFAPCKSSDRDRYMAMMENTEQVPLASMKNALPWNWETFPQWMEVMRGIPKGLNVITYVPLNSLMIYVMGYEAAKSRGATASERKLMRDMLNEAMDLGAVGFSFSHLNEFNTHKDIDGSPMPTDTMRVDDIFYLAEVLRERGAGIIQALIEVPYKTDNRFVVEELARISGRPVLQNIITAFDAMPEFHESILTWLNNCAGDGLPVYSQALLFRVWNEFKVNDYTAWAHKAAFKELTHCGGTAEKVKLAASMEFRARAIDQYDSGDMVDAGGPLESLILVRANGASAFSDFQGKTLASIATALDKPVMEIFLDIIVASAGDADFRTSEATTWDAKIISKILKHPRVIPGTSDGGAHVKFYHGAHYSTDHIMQLVREEQVMSLEEIHHKLSGVPAELVGLRQRGTLQEDYAADIFIYDYERLGYNRERYEIMCDLPANEWRRVVKAEGIKWSMVNGEIIFIDGHATGNLPGKLIVDTSGAVR